jgi:hypothetical protein
MLKTYLHRRGQIPTAVHPFEKVAITEQPQHQPKTRWVYRLIQFISVVLFAMLQSLHRRFHRNT